MRPSRLPLVETLARIAREQGLDLADRELLASCAAALAPLWE